MGAALWISAIKTIGIPLTSFLMKAQTLFSLLLGMVFLGERLNKWETVGIVITVTGGIIVAYQREYSLLVGTFTAIGAAFFYSSLSFIVKKMGQRLNMLTVANLRALGVSIFLIAYLVLTGTLPDAGSGRPRVYVSRRDYGGLYSEGVPVPGYKADRRFTHDCGAPARIHIRRALLLFHLPTRYHP